MTSQIGNRTGPSFEHPHHPGRQTSDVVHHRADAPFQIVGDPASFVIDRTGTLRWRAAALPTAFAE